MNPPDSLSILIVNWRSKDYVRKCLRSIEATCADLDPQIVVVDGGSFDGCGEMLAAEFPKVEFVQSPENVGFGRSNNLGFQKVTGTYLLLLNPDTELHPGSVQALLTALKTIPRAAMVGPRLHNPDGTLQKSSVMALPTPLNQALRSELLMKAFPNSRLWGSGEAYTSLIPTKVEAISGACMLLLSETFRALNGFHPSYFMYAEDMDLCFRIHNRIGEIHHVPASIVTHHGGGSSSSQANTFSVIKKREALSIYFRLNSQNIDNYIFRITQLSGAILRILLTYIFLPFTTDSRKNQLAATRTNSFAVANWALKKNTKT